TCALPIYAGGPLQQAEAIIQFLQLERGARAIARRSGRFYIRVVQLALQPPHRRVGAAPRRFHSGFAAVRPPANSAAPTHNEIPSRCIRTRRTPSRTPRSATRTCLTG